MTVFLFLTVVRLSLDISQPYAGLKKLITAEATIGETQAELESEHNPMSPLPLLPAVIWICPPTNSFCISKQNLRATQTRHVVSFLEWMPLTLLDLPPPLS